MSEDDMKLELGPDLLEIVFVAKPYRRSLRLLPWVHLHECLSLTHHKHV